MAIKRNHPLTALVFSHGALITSFLLCLRSWIYISFADVRFTFVLSVMLSSHVCLFLLLSPVDKYGMRRFISRCCLKIESYLQEKHNKLHIFWPVFLRKPQAYVAFFTIFCGYGLGSSIYLLQVRS